MFFVKTNFDKLSKKKDQILGVFVQTQNDLKNLLEEQNKYNSDLQVQIQKLKTESDNVSKESIGTKKMIDKITDFLN